MKKSVVFMFSGQGAQYYQMGCELFNENKVFKKWMCKLDDVIYKAYGISVINQLYYSKKKPRDRFDLLLYTHPAIFMIEYSLAQVLIENGIKPDFVLGTSLGEYASVVLSGVMDAEELLTMLVKHAEIFETFCPKGGMMAILENSKLYYENPVLNQNCEIASENYNKHFVVSGTPEGLRNIRDFLDEKEVVYQDLPVNYAFHSSFIDGVKTFMTSSLKGKEYNNPNISYVSCVYGKVINNFHDTYFWEIARKPILFREAVQCLESIGNHFYIDLGPSATLAGFIKQNLPSNSLSECFGIMTPFNHDVKNLEKTISVLNKYLYL